RRGPGARRARRRRLIRTRRGRFVLGRRQAPDELRVVDPAREPAVLGGDVGPARFETRTYDLLVQRQPADDLRRARGLRVHPPTVAGGEVRRALLLRRRLAEPAAYVLLDAGAARDCDRRRDDENETRLRHASCTSHQIALAARPRTPHTQPV